MAKPGHWEPGGTYRVTLEVKAHSDEPNYPLNDIANMLEDLGTELAVQIGREVIEDTDYPQTICLDTDDGTLACTINSITSSEEDVI